MSAPVRQKEKAMRTLTIENKKGEIIVKLYFTKDGQLHCDSWLKTEA